MPLQTVAALNPAMSPLASALERRPNARSGTPLHSAAAWALVPSPDVAPQTLMRIGHQEPKAVREVKTDNIQEHQVLQHFQVTAACSSHAPEVAPLPLSVALRNSQLQHSDPLATTSQRTSQQLYRSACEVLKCDKELHLLHYFCTKFGCRVGCMRELHTRIMCA